MKGSRSTLTFDIPGWIGQKATFDVIEGERNGNEITVTIDGMPHCLVTHWPFLTSPCRFRISPDVGVYLESVCMDDFTFMEVWISSMDVCFDPYGRVTTVIQLIANERQA
jgi:hypothetical protein